MNKTLSNPAADLLNSLFLFLNDVLFLLFQDSVSHADAATQILYNRTMVQLGLCGFRHAEIREAHNCLLDIQLGGRSKELLAQGLLPQVIRQKILEQIIRISKRMNLQIGIAV